MVWTVLRDLCGLAQMQRAASIGEILSWMVDVYSLSEPVVDLWICER